MTGDTRYDVAVIGAGINGAGIARDAALRGLSVVVFDKNDMCSGTSAVSSRLIHGGLRYLEYGEIPLVYESLHERRCLRNIAGHLVKPIRITIPVFVDGRRSKRLVRLGMIAYDLLSWNKRLPRHEMLDRSELLAEEPGVRQDGLVGAARYYDAQVTFAERLVLENLLAARAAGADVNTHCDVTGFVRGNDRIEAVEFVDAHGEQGQAAVASVVNAAGPWVDEVLDRSPHTEGRLIGGTKGSHIVVPPFVGAPKDAFYVEAARDGRPFFIIPWNGQYLIGTTDIRYNGDLDRIRASREEVDYLLGETNRVFPKANLDIGAVQFAYAGVRPLPHRQGGPESSITRRHIIRRNKAIACNLLSIIGGKLTTYRNLGEQTVDRLTRLLHRKLPACRTRDVLLPGASGIAEAAARLAALEGLTEADRMRLLDIYGGRSAGIAELVQSGVGTLEAEVRFVVREEFPRTLIDVVFRRMMLGYMPDQGRSNYDEIAAAAAVEFGWPDSERASQLGGLVAFANSLRVA